MPASSQYVYLNRKRSSPRQSCGWMYLELKPRSGGRELLTQTAVHPLNPETQNNSSRSGGRRVPREREELFWVSGLSGWTAVWVSSSLPPLRGFNSKYIHPQLCRGLERFLFR